MRPETKKDPLPLAINACAQAVNECAAEKDFNGINHILFRIHLLMRSLYLTIETHSKNKQKIICNESMNSVQVDFSGVKVNVEFSQIEIADDEKTAITANIDILHSTMLFCLQNAFRDDGAAKIAENFGLEIYEDYVDFIYRFIALADLISNCEDRSQAGFECFNFFISKWIFEMAIDARFFNENEAPIRSKPIMNMQTEFSIFREYRTAANRMPLVFFAERERLQKEKILSKFSINPRQ